MLKIICYIFAASFLTVVSQMFLKKGLINIGGIKTSNFSDFSESFLKLFQEKYIFLGAFIAILAAFGWLMIMSKKELTVALPIGGGISFLLLFLFSWIFLGEVITFWKIIGVFFIFLGMVLLITKV